MPHLNTFNSLEVVSQDGFDALTAVDMGEAIALSQVDEGGQLQDVVIGREQAERLVAILRDYLA